jgi:hypothetical protein
MWQYRVIVFEHPDGNTFEVHTCNIETNTLDLEIVKMIGDSVEELEDNLVLIKRALSKSSINSYYFKNIKE